MAGLRAAIELAEAGTVLVVAKDSLRESSSEYAQGGIAVALSDDDEVALHEQDTLYAGDGLCDPVAVRTLVEEGPAAIQELIEWGAAFDREGNKLAFTREGAHSRDPAKPLITLEQHEELLGLIAQEMWISATEVLRQETLDLLADLFAESKSLSAAQSHQIRERLPQHSLLATRGQSRPQYAFDHEDFRKYFLGQAIGRAIQDHSTSDIRALLRAGALPADTCDAIVRHVARGLLVALRRQFV